MIYSKYLIAYYNNETKTVHNSIEYFQSAFDEDKDDIVTSFNKKHQNSAILNIIKLL